MKDKLGIKSLLGLAPLDGKALVLARLTGA